MGFLDKLKKTLWNSFFGKPERQTKTRHVGKKRLPAPAKKKENKSAVTVKLKSKKTKAQNSKKLKSSTRIPKSTPKPPKLPKLPAAKGRQLKPAMPTASPRSISKVSKSISKSQGVLVGHVTHFFSQASAAAIKIEAQNLSVGDEIQFKGATTNFKIRINSMQINRLPVTQAVKGSEIGILVKKKVREGDEVFKL